MRLVALAALAPALWAAPQVTFSRDVAPILYRHCATCHHPGAVAPFPLLTYEDAAKRSRLIAEVTARRYMPPWLPDAPPDAPKFAGERRLAAAEIATIGRWAAAGAPEGNPSETPPAPDFAEGWVLGKPDLEASMRAGFEVPAEGPDLYQCFAIPLPKAALRYIRALDIRPGNARVVHHALLFQDDTGVARRRDTGNGYSCFGTPGFLPARGLGGWTPGSQPFTLEAGMAETLYPGADLVLQVHYHPDGKPETDRTRVALYFTDQKPTRRSYDVALGSNRIDIPPGDRHYKVTDHFTIPVDVNALAVVPHAHYVCKEMLAYAVLPDGARRTLIHIPDWNFNWQQQYRYATPVPLPAGTHVEMEFRYDNSDENVRNPNHPPKRVEWGPGSADEMAGLHLEVEPVRAADGEELGQALWGKMMRALGGGIYRK